MELAKLTPTELDTHVRNGTFRLAFVGMSNAGKSFRSRVLQEALDFVWFQVDEGIQHTLGFSTMEEISEWLGYPTDAGYDEREEKYLALENELTKQASMQTDGKNLVFDTTGSVVHLADSTLHTLHENCLVVHLDVGDDSLGEPVERFFEKPKPVAWSGFLNHAMGETTEEAVRRCYPELLAFRLEHYRKLAHVNVPVHEVRDTSAEETLDVIKKHLAH